MGCLANCSKNPKKQKKITYLVIPSFPLAADFIVANVLGHRDAAEKAKEIRLNLR